MEGFTWKAAESPANRVLKGGSTCDCGGASSGEEACCEPLGVWESSGERERRKRARLRCGLSEHGTRNPPVTVRRYLIEK
eukprot:3770602-Pleurochrysis_carterae.AAC.1